MIYLGKQPVGVVSWQPSKPDQWAKPADWPDIETLSLPSTDESCIYFLYDCETEVRYAGFTTGSSNTELSIASYSNGVLSEFDSTDSFKSANNWYIPLPDNCKYAVVRLKNIQVFEFATSSTYGLYYYVNNNGSNQPCLWYYGKLYSDTAVDLYANGSAGISTIELQRVRLYLSPLITIGYGFAPCMNLKSLNINDGNFNNTGKLYSSASVSINAPEIVLRNVNTSAAKIISSRMTNYIDLSGLMTDSGSISGSQSYQDCSTVKSIILRTNGLKITTMYYMFSGCRNLETLDMTGCDLSECSSVASTFSNCCNLKNITLGTGLAISLGFSNCPRLTHESLVNGIIAKLGNVSESTTLTLHSSAKAKLSASDISALEAKGWTLA